MSFCQCKHALLSLSMKNKQIHFFVKKTIQHRQTGPVYSSSSPFIHTSVYYVLQSQKVATGYAKNKIDKEAVKIDI